jgi:hypothetical protein
MLMRGEFSDGAISGGGAFARIRKLQTSGPMASMGNVFDLSKRVS